MKSNRTSKTNTRKVDSLIPENIASFPLGIMGHKRHLLNPILSLIPDNASTLFDAFGGTGVISWASKHLGMKVIINDVRRFANLRHRVLIANNRTILSDKDLKILRETNSHIYHHTEKLYGNVFGKKNSNYLDNWQSNISKLSDPTKRDIAVFIPIVCIIAPLKFGVVRFTVTDELAAGQHYWNTDLDGQVLDYARNVFPSLIHDNGQRNLVFQEDAVQLVSKVEADVMVADTPYACKGGAYEQNYAFYDNLVLLLSGKGNEITRPHGFKVDLPTYTNFSTRTSSLFGFSSFLKNADHIPFIIFNYNTTSGIHPEEIGNIAKMYGRSVSIQYIDYRFPSCKKGGRKMTKEVLIVCKST